MDDLEHLVAIYYDDNGQRCTIRADQLEDDQVFALAKEVTLHDESEQHILFARDIDGKRRHFFKPPSEDKRAVYGTAIETDRSHGKRVEWNYLNLLYRKKWKIGFRDGSGFTKIFDINGYDWDTEVYRIMGKEAIVRHDLFGQPRHVGMSKFHPWIAIEVIHSHYPEPQAFDAMIQMSAQVPMLVFFDLTKRREYFFKIDPEEGTIRCTYYIFDGRVWNGDQTTRIDSASKLQVELEGRLRRLKKSA